MNIYKLTATTSALIVLISCGVRDLSKDFSMEMENSGKKFKVSQLVGISLKSKSGKAVDSVVYYLDGNTLPIDQNRILLKSPSLGEKTLKARFLSEGQWGTLEKKITLLAEEQPQIYSYQVLNSFPHDQTAFTQGLEFHGDTLYESTGQKGASTLRKVDYRSGRVLKSVSLEKQYFGEGITILNDTIYMLTWQQGTGLLFNRETLEQIGSFKYGESKEGWGLCNDGRQLYKSDGTQRIWKLNPSTLEEKNFIETVTNRSVFNKANELEYAEGKIYANVWQKESMMIINPETGAIEGVVNFGGLSNQVTKHPKLDVFNGVAYHPERKTFFVTGKNWDKLFEVRIVKKEE